MADLEVVGLERQPDLIVTSSAPEPGNNATASGLPQGDREVTDTASRYAHASRRAPDFKRFKEALRAQPPELAPRLREPPDPASEAALLGFCRWARWQIGLYSWHVLAPVGCLALGLGLVAFITDLGAAWSTRTDQAPPTSFAGDTAAQDDNEPPPAPPPAPPQPQTAREIATAHVGDPRSMTAALPVILAGNDNALVPGSSAAAAGRVDGDQEVRTVLDHFGDGTLLIPTEPSDRSSMPAPLTVSLTASGRAALSSASPAAVASGHLTGGVKVQADLDRPGEGTHLVPIESSDDAYSLARRLLRSGDRDGAEQAFKRSLERTVSPAAAYELGHLLQEQGRYVEAANSYQLAVQLAPERAYMLYDLGGALAKLGRLDEAAANFERAAELDSTNPFILYDWGWALERTGALALAEDRYSAAFAAGPDTAAGSNARARLRDLGRYAISSR